MKCKSAGQYKSLRQNRCNAGSKPGALVTNGFLHRLSARCCASPVFIIYCTLFICFFVTGFAQQTSPFRQHPFKVLIFLDTECPICQQTARKVQEMAIRYNGQVQFTAIYPTETVTLAEVNEFNRTYKLTVPHRLDPAHKLVKKYQVTTTPEALLLSDQNKILYRGSVDNQFYRLGRSRPEPTEFYLNDALTAVLVNKPVAIRQTNPTGCLINQH